jgi:predicted outer membrane repeat protein
LHADKCSVRIKHCDLVNNSARVFGGFLFGRDSIILVHHSSFNDNLAGWAGGAIHIQSTNFVIERTNHSVTILIEHNIASHSSGGFLYGKDSPIKIYHANFNKNQAPLGGAISIESTNLIIGGGWLVDNNLATVVDGFLDARRLSIHLEQYNTINNSTTVEPLIHLKKCQFMNNSAERGGAILVKDTDLLLVGNSCMEPLIV